MEIIKNKGNCGLNNFKKPQTDFRFFFLNEILIGGADFGAW